MEIKFALSVTVIFVMNASKYVGKLYFKKLDDKSFSLGV